MWSAVAEWAGRITEWVVRCTLAAMALLGLFGSGLWVFAEPTIGPIFGATCLALFCLYVVLAMLWPSLLKVIGRGLGQIASKPYNAFLDPYVLEPIDKAGEYVGRILELVLALLLQAIGWVMKAALWLIVIGLLIALTFAVIQGIAALPVSVAIIIGALVIANALRERG